jgi:hypothetical protein
MREEPSRLSARRNVLGRPIPHLLVGFVWVCLLLVVASCKRSASPQPLIGGTPPLSGATAVTEASATASALGVSPTPAPRVPPPSPSPFRGRFFNYVSLRHTWVSSRQGAPDGTQVLSLNKLD